jgi:hypothetical protein
VGGWQFPSIPSRTSPSDASRHEHRRRTQEQRNSVLMNSSYIGLNREWELIGVFHRRRVSCIAHIADQRTYRGNFGLTSSQQGLAATRSPPV